jgi:hypothetical protein
MSRAELTGVLSWVGFAHLFRGALSPALSQTERSNGLFQMGDFR